MNGQCMNDALQVITIAHPEALAQVSYKSLR